MKKIEYFVAEWDEFQRNVRRLTKKKRFFSLPGQVNELKEEQLEQGIFPGTLVKRADEPIQYELYKLRIANPDTNVGKSGGYRVYYIVVTESKVVVLLTIYYKKEDEAVADAYIEGLVAGVLLDFIPVSETEADI